MFVPAAYISRSLEALASGNFLTMESSHFDFVLPSRPVDDKSSDEGLVSNESWRVQWALDNLKRFRGEIDNGQKCENCLGAELSSWWVAGNNRVAK